MSSTGTQPRNILGTVGPRVNLGTLLDKLITTDGTFSVSGSEYRGHGILVALSGVVIDPDTACLTEEASAWLSDAVSDVLAHPVPFYRPRYLSVWTDPVSGLLYLDIVEAFPREDLAEAVAAGRDRNQIEIWDAGRQELINTGAID